MIYWINMVKFLDIHKITASFEPELSEAINRVVRSGWFLLGEEVNSFEKEYAEYIESKHCIGVANGLDALRLILRAYIEMGIMEEGDEVIVPANTYIASILAITDNHLVPVLVEPDIHTFNLDLSLLEKQITHRTRVIMVVHLYGRACWSRELEAISDKYNLKVIEDNAQAAGSVVQAAGISRRTGSLGHAAGHSFYPGKNLGALGDGGAVTTDDDELAELIRSLANYGSSEKYVNDYRGINSRLDEIQSAVLRVKLGSLDSDNQYRRNIAMFYIDHITNPDIIMPGIKELGNDLEHVWHLFVIRSPHRDRMKQYLTECGVQTLIHYPIPPHRQRAYKDLNSLSLPVTERIHDEVLSLPISQVMPESEVNRVVEVLNKFDG